MVVLNRKILALLQVVDYQAPAMASFNGSLEENVARIMLQLILEAGVDIGHRPK